MSDVQLTPFDKEFQKPMRELRCLHCHRLLCKEYVYRGRIEIKCWGSDCGEMNRFVFRDHRDNQNAKIKTVPTTVPTNIKKKE